ncbi:MAG: BatA domain-containing protein, partial [Planctomycetales bacterium]
MFTWLFSLFANPWVLLWLPAAAIPVVIHLWNRRKYREIPWAAMEYLLAAIVKSARRMRIEQLLLLLLRVLLVLLVVFALAKPFLDNANLLFQTGSRTHRVFLIDGSYSMAYQPSDKRAFDVARQRAIEIVKQGREGDGYSLVLMTDTPQIVVGQATFDQAEFIEEIEKLTLVHSGADLDAGLKAVENVIQQAPEGQLAQHHVYILSDLGRNTWDLAQIGPAGDERAERLARLAEHGSVEVLAIGGERHENLAVTRLRVEDSYATITNPVVLMATVHNFSDQDRSGQSIELWVDGRRVDQKIEDIDAGTDVTVGFQHRFHISGEHAIEIRVGGDSLDIDNRRYLALPVKEHLNALLVSGKRGSTYPIEAALGGGDFARGLSGTIRPEAIPESKLLELDLTNYD